MTETKARTMLSDMILFHVSDLHLGKTFHGFSLMEDQEFILARIIDRISAEQPDALLIAGDVYDRPVPPPEAIELLDNFLMQCLALVPDLKIVVIPGNHDGGPRMGFGARLLERQGVHIVTNFQAEPACVLEKHGETAIVWALPFLSPAVFRNGWQDDDEVKDAGTTKSEVREFPSQQKLMEFAVSKIHGNEVWKKVESRKRDVWNDTGQNVDSSVPWRFLVAHCFAAGANVSDSETSYIGAAEQVGTEVFSGFDVTALGHLHFFQSPAPRVWYSGSPMPYGVPDAGRKTGLCRITLKSGDPLAHVECIPRKPLRGFRKLRGFFGDILLSPPSAEEREDYVEITLCDTRPVANPLHELRKLYPRIYTLKSEADEAAAGSSSTAMSETEASLLDPEKAQSDDTIMQAFIEFHQEMKGKAPSKESMDQFELLLKEARNAANQA